MDTDVPPSARGRPAALPDEVWRYAERLTTAAGRYYGSRRYGVYLHGSVAFGHFVAASSDLDVLVVTGEPAGDGAGFFEAVRRLPRPSSVAGLECSVLDRADLVASGLNRPFRCHFTIGDEEERFVSGDGHPGDADLVLHFAVCGTAGVAICGPPATETFPVPSRPEILEALVGELEWARDDGDWSYTVLNAARAWRYVTESVLSSKLDGWLWARSRAREQIVLDRALVAYLTPRDAHRVPEQAMAGLVEDARDLLGDVQARLRAALRDDRAGG